MARGGPGATARHPYVTAGEERYVDPSFANGRLPATQLPNERRAAGVPAPTRGVATEELTEREIEVLRHIAQGLSNSEIAATLGLGVAEVAAHKSEGMRKLGFKSRAAVVRFADALGWRPGPRR